MTSYDKMPFIGQFYCMTSIFLKALYAVSFRSTQLSMGPVNSVIHYLDVNHGDAVYLAPVQLTRQQQAPGAGGTAGSLHAAVMQNFRSACQIIHG